jgi:predicted transcriptional regulator
MNLTHATLVLVLAAKIHGTNTGVRAAAKNVVKQLPRSQRDLTYLVIDSEQSLEMAWQIALNLDT